MTNSYSIIIKETLSGIEQDIMLDLYQPIVGVIAIGLYQTLVHEEKTLRKLNNIKFEHKRLQKIAGLTEKQFNDAIAKLVATHLITTLINKKNGNVHYTLLAPLSIEEFFANELYKQTLISKIGLENAEAIHFVWKDNNEVDEEEYEEITNSFVEIFSDEILDINHEATKHKLKLPQFMGKKKQLYEKLINLDELNAELQKYAIKLDYNDKHLTRQLNDILAFKSFSILQLSKIISNSFDYDTLLLDQDKINQEIQAEITNITQTPNQQLDANLIMKKTEFEMFTPETFIQSFFDRQIDHNEKRIVSDLINAGFSYGAINALIEYSAYRNNNRVVINYIEKIAKTLTKMKLFNTAQVMIYLKDAKQAVDKKIANYKNGSFNKSNSTNQNHESIPEIGYQKFDNSINITIDDLLAAAKNI